MDVNKKYKKSMNGSRRKGRRFRNFVLLVLPALFEMVKGWIGFSTCVGNLRIPNHLGEEGKKVW